ncbi:hypothetical protein HPP92_011972 [Vanilla planifolia]|uniref:Uncharacterized protein n=1 Tax=Vanilla planifolia TaxID=51239 RepID=A0A835QYM8_VANPL|nr:hypothetical protein HPP92_011972 [Vanilla planifolia]
MARNLRECKPAHLSGSVDDDHIIGQPLKPPVPSLKELGSDNSLLSNPRCNSGPRNNVE